MTTATEPDAEQVQREEGDLDVFISYSRRNAEFAYRLEELLKERGLEVWLDKDDIPPSSEWRDEIEDGIQRADGIVVIITPDLAQSVECTKEIDRAEAIGKVIIPILHIDVEKPIEVQEALSKRNYIFWRDDSEAEAALEKIEQSLKSDPAWTKNHTRINRRAILWDKKDRDKSLLERKSQLAEDELEIAKDRPPEQPQVTELMRTFIIESRVAERKRTRRNFLISIGVAVVTSVIATIAVLQFLEATRQRQSTQSRALASQATSSISDERDLAALQALEAVRVANTTDARASLLRVLATPDRFQRRIDVHEHPITAVAISPDGLFAATGDSDGTVWLWELDPDEELDPAEPASELLLEEGIPVANLAWEVDDGNHLLLGFSASGLGQIWETDKGTSLPLGTEVELGQTAISLGGDAAYVAGWDGDSIVIFTLDAIASGSDEEVARLDLPPDGEVADIGLSNDGSLVAWSTANVVFVWEWGAGPDAVVPWEFKTPVTTIEFGPGSLIAVGEGEGNIHLIDLLTGIQGEVIPQPVNAAVDLSFAAVADPFEIGAAALLASAHTNGDVNLISVFADEASIDGFVDETLRGHKEVTTSVVFGPSLQLASGDFTGEVIWWEAIPTVALGQQLPDPFAGDSHGIDVGSVAFLDDDVVVSLDLDGVAIVTDVNDGTGTTVSDASVEEWLTALDAAGDRILAGVNTGDVVFIDNDAETISPSSHGAPISIVDVSPDGASAVTVSPDDSVVVIWDLAGQSERASFVLPDGFAAASALHFGGADVWLGVATNDGPTVLRVDAASGELRSSATLELSTPAVLDEDAVTSLAVSSDGAQLAVGVSDRRIRLLDAQTLEELESGKDFEGHREIVTGLAFVDENETLISADKAGVVMVWDVSSRRAVTDLPGPTDGVNDLELNPAGTLLAVASEDDSVYTWVFDVEIWIDRACSLAGRNMTEREWELYGPADQGQVDHCTDIPGAAGDPAEYNTERLVD